MVFPIWPRLSKLRRGAVVVGMWVTFFLIGNHTLFDAEASAWART